MNVLRKLDDAVIDRVFQPIADRLAAWSTPQELARSLIIGSTVFFTGACVSAAREDGLRLWVAALDGLCVAFSFGVARELSASVGYGLMPAARHTRWMLRIVMLFSLALLIPYRIYHGLDQRGFMWMMDGLLWLAGYYFAACRRHPPKPRRQEVRLGDALPQEGR